MSSKRNLNLIKKMNALRNMEIEPSKWRPEIFKEDDKFMYYYSQEKKIIKIAKEYEERPGVIRLKWLEGPYRLWKYRTVDGKNAIKPILLSIISGYIIWELAMELSAMDHRMVERARLPEDFTQEQLDQNKQLKEDIKKWKDEKQQIKEQLKELAE